MILLAALVGAAATSAQAGVHFGFSFGLPLPVFVAPPTVVVATPVAPCPTRFVETIPACPGVDYVWAAGYWSYRNTGYTWVRGSWNHRPEHVEFVRHDYDHHDYDHRFDRHDSDRHDYTQRSYNQHDRDGHDGYRR